MRKEGREIGRKRRNREKIREDKGGKNGRDEGGQGESENGGTKKRANSGKIMRGEWREKERTQGKRKKDRRILERRKGRIN